MPNPDTITISPRFCGPARSGNGGYVSGVMAHRIGKQATVRLYAPPPLDRPLRFEDGEGLVRLLDGDRLIAEARPSDQPVESPRPPSLGAARKASTHFVGFEQHDFPRCFVCGTGREPGDGLRIFPGHTPSGEMVAAPWTVDESLAENGRVGDEFIWAALDCPSVFPLFPMQPGRTMVLGELTCRVEGTVRPGDTCTVIGWRTGEEGRKRYSGSALFDASGKRLGATRAVWIDVARDAFPE